MVSSPYKPHMTQTLFNQDQMARQQSHEVEVGVPASKAWELYGTLQLARLAEERLSDLFEKIEVVEGDGGEGTILNLIFAPGVPVPHYKEKFTKVDDEKRVKEAEIVEGGYLDLGFTFYLVRFEIKENGEESCIIKSTIEYEFEAEAAEKASLLASIKPVADVAEIAKSHLLKNKASKND